MSFFEFLCSSDEDIFDSGGYDDDDRWGSLEGVAAEACSRGPLRPATSVAAAATPVAPTSVADPNTVVLPEGKFTRSELFPAFLCPFCTQHFNVQIRRGTRRMRMWKRVGGEGPSNFMCDMCMGSRRTTIFFDPSDGNDDGDGSLERPFGSFDAAQEAANRVLELPGVKPVCTEDDSTFSPERHVAKVAIQRMCTGKGPNCLLKRCIFPQCTHTVCTDMKHGDGVYEFTTRSGNLYGNVDWSWRRHAQRCGEYTSRWPRTAVGWTITKHVESRTDEESWMGEVWASLRERVFTVFIAMRRVAAQHGAHELSVLPSEVLVMICQHFHTADGRRATSCSGPVCAGHWNAHVRKWSVCDECKMSADATVEAHDLEGDGTGFVPVYCPKHVTCCGKTIEPRDEDDDKRPYGHVSPSKFGTVCKSMLCESCLDEHVCGWEFDDCF